MDKKQLKKIIIKESPVLAVFFLSGVLGNLLFPCLYNYYIHHFAVRSNATYSVALVGWWFLVSIGYLLGIFVRYS